MIKTQGIITRTGIDGPAPTSMPDLPIHIFDFGQGGISGSLYFRSKRSSEMINTTHLTRYEGFKPMGYGSIESIQSSTDSPEARELYSCFRPLTPEERQEKSDNEWKHRYVELPVSIVFPRSLPVTLTDRKCMRTILNNRGGSVVVSVMPQPEKEDLTGPEPVPAPKPVAPVQPVSPRRVSVRSISSTPVFRPTLIRGMFVYRPLTPEEQRQQRVHMATALAYISRVRQSFPAIEPALKRARQ